MVLGMQLKLKGAAGGTGFMHHAELDYFLCLKSQVQLSWFCGFVEEKVAELKAVGPLGEALTYEIEFIEHRLKWINEYHTIEVDGEKHSGIPYGGPQGFADMSRFNEPRESQVLKRQLFPWS